MLYMYLYHLNFPKSVKWRGCKSISDELILRECVKRNESNTMYLEWIHTNNFKKKSIL